MGKCRKEVSLERQRVLREVSGNGGNLKYSDLARKIQDHPAFRGGVKFNSLKVYVKRRLEKSCYHPKERASSPKALAARSRHLSGFDAVKNSIKLKNGASLEEAKRIENAVAQIRPHYERLENENIKLKERLEVLSGENAAVEKKLTRAETALQEAVCHSCEEIKKECGEKIMKTNGEHAQLLVKFEQVVRENQELRERARRNALAYVTR